MESTFTALPRYVMPDGKTTKWEVQISYDHKKHPGCYGYFEHDEYGEGGGLWFERVGDKWSLTDYDGVASLPANIAHTLREAGFLVDPLYF